ncbi:MAG: thioredoxin domain-containing protein, partial [Terriglobia bacterium]
AWNGLMIASLAKGSAVLDEPKYLDAAVRAAEFVLTRMQQDGRLLRSYRQGRAHLMAYLDDYAFLMDALLWLYEGSGRLRWLDEAERLMTTAIQFFWDGAAGGFFFTASDHEQLIVRSKLATDNAIPSGNSVMIANLLRLSVLLGRADLREKAGEILTAFGGSTAQSPFAHERFLSGLEAWHEAFQEIALVGDLHSPLAKQLLRVVYESYLPNKVVALLDPSWPEAERLAKRLPLLAGKQPVQGKPTAFVCRNYACQSPTSDPETLRQQLGLRSASRWGR